MVYLHAHVSSRTRPVEHGHFNITGISKRRRGLPTAYAEIGLGYLRQGGKSGLEVFFLTFELILKVGSQGHVAQSRHEDSLRTHIRRGRHGIRQLVDITEQTGIEQGLHHILSSESSHIPDAEVGILLLGVRLDNDAEHLAAVAAHYILYHSTDR